MKSTFDFLLKVERQLQIHGFYAEACFVSQVSWDFRMFWCVRGLIWREETLKWRNLHVNLQTKIRWLRGRRFFAGWLVSNRTSYLKKGDFLELLYRMIIGGSSQETARDLSRFELITWKCGSAINCQQLFHFCFFSPFFSPNIVQLNALTLLERIPRLDNSIYNFISWDLWPFVFLKVEFLHHSSSKQKPISATCIGSVGWDQWQDVEQEGP